MLYQVNDFRLSRFRILFLNSKQFLAHFFRRWFYAIFLLKEISIECQMLRKNVIQRHSCRLVTGKENSLIINNSLKICFLIKQIQHFRDICFGFQLHTNFSITHWVCPYNTGKHILPDKHINPLCKRFRIVGHHYELDDFQLQSVTSGREAMGEALVKLRDGGKLYSGRGISTDIVGASIRAYLNALNKIVYREK